MIDIVECLNCKHNPDMSAKQREIIRAEAYQQGKADAIDECIAKITELNSNGNEVWWHTMCNILEQLKEQNNE